MADLPGLYIPQAHRTIPTGAGQQGPVRAESNFLHTVAVSPQDALHASASHMPENNQMVSATAGQQLTVRAKGHRQTPACMPLQLYMR